MGHFLYMVVLWNEESPAVLEIFSGECDAVVHVTLNDL